MPSHPFRRRRRPSRAWRPSPATILVLVVAVIVRAGVGASRSGAVQLASRRPPSVASPAASRPRATPAGTIHAASPAAIGNTPAATPESLTPARLARYRPDKLGEIPILESQSSSPTRSSRTPTKAAQFVRTADQFLGDLNWLYARNFYVAPPRDVFLDQLRVPPGKHPVAPTFDDSTAGQFRFLKASNGALTIDPNSAVGILEAMFTRHPDFGRGGIFFTLPYGYFDWPNEPDQTPDCTQKLEGPLAHGYEIGDHTVDHSDLLDVSDATFKQEVGGIRDLLGYVPQATIAILALPYGNYPDQPKHPEQRAWLRHGFVYEGHEIRLLGALMVGASPAPSPDSTGWAPVFTPRIQAWDNPRQADTAYWFKLLARDPAILYTGDGHVRTVTILRPLPPDLTATLDQAKVAAAG